MSQHSERLANAINGGDRAAAGNASTDVKIAAFAHVHPDAVSEIARRANRGEPIVAAGTLACGNYEASSPAWKFISESDRQTLVTAASSMGKTLPAAFAQPAGPAASSKPYRDADGTLRYSDGTPVGSKPVASFVKLPAKPAGSVDLNQPTK